MLFDWSAECTADDPVLVVPWSDPNDPAVRFVDLREDPYEVEQIVEAERHQPLLQALRALNAPRSPVFTAKCDAWPLDPGEEAEEVEALRIELDLMPEDARDGFASYIDLIWRDRALFTSFHQQEHLVHRMARRAAVLDQPSAALECVIRPAMVDLAGPQEGFALSFYVKALGPTAAAAEANWASALEAAVAMLRSRDLTPTT
jgi:hypothetical protein